MKYVFTLVLLLGLQGCAIPNTLHIPYLHSETQVSKKEQTCVICEDDTSEFDDEFGEEETNLYDPLEAYNEIMTSFNDTLFTYILNPISQKYAYVIPEFMRIGISNALHNLQFPIRFTNNVLQAKFHNASEETVRFLVNSTIGIGGLFDPANTQLHLYPHKEDFGQTLGYYGVGSGFHVVLPVLGASNLRDIVGLTVDGYLSPLIYDKRLIKYKIPQNYTQSFGIYGWDAINKNSLHLGAYENLKKDAIELYPFLRDIYEQKRTSDIEE